MLATLAVGRASAAVLPPGFQESVVFSGLTEPTSIAFSAYGRVFAAERGGQIKVFDSLTDPTPTLYADLRTNVHAYDDRGTSGHGAAPELPDESRLYVSYSHDAVIGGTAPRWGTPGANSDPCPTPPGPSLDGCVISGRLSRSHAVGRRRWPVLLGLGPRRLARAYWRLGEASGTTAADASATTARARI